MTDRIGDRFLTVADKASLRERPARVWDFGESPALLLVDVYRWVFGDHPQPQLEEIEKWPLHCGLAGWTALASIVRVLAAARDAGIPVVHVTGSTDETQLNHWATHCRLQPRSEGLRNAGWEQQFAHRYDIMHAVAPLPGEEVIRKADASAFWETPLVAYLNGEHVDSLVVCGETTSGCVRATVVDARIYRYKVIVPEEAVFDRHEACHAINLFDMQQKYADVLPVDEVLEELGSRTALLASR